MSKANSIADTHREEQRQLLEEYRLLKRRLETVDNRLNELDVILRTIEAVEEDAHERNVSGGEVGGHTE